MFSIAAQQYCVGQEVVFHLMLVGARGSLKRCEATEQQPAARLRLASIHGPVARVGDAVMKDDLISRFVGTWFG
jgi:hypothetical protein